MSYKGQVLRGEKWFNLCKDTKDDYKLAEIKVYKESCEKVKVEKKEEKMEKKIEKTISKEKK